MPAENQYADGYPIKLVRDDIGRRLGGSGSITYEPLTDRAEHIKRLRSKLAEEAIEYLLNPSVSELADVLGAARALAEVDLEVPWSDVEAADAQKCSERGGFRAGMVMVSHHHADGQDLLTEAEAQENRHG